MVLWRIRPSQNVEGSKILGQGNVRLLLLLALLLLTPLTLHDVPGQCTSKGIVSILKSQLLTILGKSCNDLLPEVLKLSGITNC